MSPQGRQGLAVTGQVSDTSLGEQATPLHVDSACGCLCSMGELSVATGCPAKPEVSAVWPYTERGQPPRHWLSLVLWEKGVVRFCIMVAFTDTSSAFFLVFTNQTGKERRGGIAPWPRGPAKWLAHIGVPKRAAGVRDLAV